MFYGDFNSYFFRDYALNPQNGEIRVSRERIDEVIKYVIRNGTFHNLKIPNGDNQIHFFYEIFGLGNVELISNSQGKDGTGFKIGSDHEWNIERILKEADKYSEFRKEMKGKSRQAGNRPPSVFPRLNERKSLTFH